MTGRAERDAERTARILTVLAAAPVPMSFSAVARAAELPGSAAAHLLHALVDTGALVRDDRGRYVTSRVA